MPKRSTRRTLWFLRSSMPITGHRRMASFGQHSSPRRTNTDWQSAQSEAPGQKVLGRRFCLMRQDWVPRGGCRQSGTGRFLPSRSLMPFTSCPVWASSVWSGSSTRNPNQGTGRHGSPIRRFRSLSSWERGAARESREGRLMAIMDGILDIPAGSPGVFCHVRVSDEAWVSCAGVHRL